MLSREIQDARYWAKPSRSNIADGAIDPLNWWHSQNGHRGNLSMAFERLSHHERVTLLEWIAGNIQTRKTVNLYQSSYGLKHRFEESPRGFYISNGAFKGAMLAAGHVPANPGELNWLWRIKKVK